MAHHLWNPERVDSLRRQGPRVEGTRLKQGEEGGEAQARAICTDAFLFDSPLRR